MDDCVKQQEHGLYITVSNVIMDLLETVSAHEMVCKSENNFDAKSGKTVNTCNMSLTPGCYKEHSRNSCLEDFVKNMPLSSCKEHSKKSLPIVESVHLIVSSMLDVIHTVTTMVKKVEFYCLSNDFDKRFASADKQFSPNFSSQSLKQDVFSHMISSSYPTTIVLLPFNFSRKQFCNSTSAFHAEFQLPIPNSGMASHEASSEKISLKSVCSQQTCDSNFSSLLCYSTISDQSNSVSSDEVKATAEKSFNNIYSARDENVVARLEEKHSECFHDASEKLVVKVITSEPTTGNNLNSLDKGLNIIDVCQSFSAFQNKTVNHCLHSLPRLNGCDLIGQNFAFETRVSPASKIPYDNDVEMCDKIINCCLHANTCDSAGLYSPVELFDITSTVKLDAIGNIEKTCPTAVHDFFHTSNHSGKCESLVNVLVEIDSQSNANCFFTSTPVDQDIANVEVPESKDFCDGNSAKITETFCFGSSLDNEVKTVKHDSLWFNFVNGASLKTRKVASITKVSGELLEDKKGVNSSSRCIRELFAKAESTNEVFSYSKDLSDSTEDLNKAFFHSSSVTNTQEKLNESVFKSSQLTVDPELQDVPCSQSNTKLSKFGPHQRKITNSITQTAVEIEVTSAEQVIINTTSGQLLMRCPSLNDTIKNKVVQWKPFTWNSNKETIQERQESTDAFDDSLMKSVVEAACGNIPPAQVINGCRDQIPAISNNADNSLVPAMTPLISAARSYSENSSGPDELKSEQKTKGLKVQGQQHELKKLGQFRIMTKQIAFDSDRASKAKFNFSPLCNDRNSRHLFSDFINESRETVQSVRHEDIPAHSPMVMNQMDQKNKNTIATKNRGPVSSAFGSQAHCHVVPQLLAGDSFVHGKHQIPIIDQKVPIDNEIYHYNCDDKMYEENICQSKDPSCSIDGDFESELVSPSHNGFINCDNSLISAEMCAVQHATYCGKNNTYPERLDPICPLNTCNRRRRIGLSRRKKVSSLHKDYKPYNY